MVVAETKKVPKLRFPGFRDEWEERKLGKISKFIGGGTPSKQVVKYWEGSIPWVSSSDVPDDDIHGISYTRFISEEAIKHSATKLVPANSILAVSRVGVGKLAINEKATCTSQDFTNILPDKRHGTEFVAYLLKSKKLKLLSFNQGSTIKGFTINDLATLKISTPILDEQKKIAGFLTLVDERIELMEKKLELSKKYKKGLMQKLFPQKGQTNPSLRFKKDDGSNFPDWVSIKLGEIAKRISERNSTDVGGVLTNSATRGIISQQDFFEKDIAVQGNLSNYYLVQMDDFVYNPRISSSAPVGPFNRNQHGIGLMSPLYTIYRVAEKGNISHVENYLKTSAWHRYMKMVANYGARHDRMAISFVDLDMLPIPIPVDEERNKIGDFISSIDRIIKEQERELGQAKQFKKALLQQMFV